MKKRKFLVLAVFVLGILAILGGSGILGVGSIEVERNGTPCLSDDQVRKDSEISGQNILFLSPEKISQKLQNKYPCVKSVRIEKKFPKDVKLFVDGRVALVHVTSYKLVSNLDLDNLEATPSSQAALLDWSLPTAESEEFLVDDSGIIIATYQNESLPRLFMPEVVLKVGANLGSDLFNKIAKILEGLNKAGMTSTDLTLNGDDLLIHSSPKIAFTLKKDVEREVISLQLILQKAKIDERGIDTLDLRFDKPIVRFLPKK